MTTLVLIGMSPRCYFIAEQLSRKLGGHAHLELIWLVNSEKMILPSSLTTVLGVVGEISLKKKFEHLRLVTTEVKSLSLRDRRITTTTGSFNYDYLILDQARLFSVGELKKLRQGWLQLITTLQARLNTGQKAAAEVVFDGREASSVQLALALRADVAERFPKVNRYLEIICQGVKDSSLKEFLTRHQISARRAVSRPGMIVGSPRSMVASQKIRGLRIDQRGQAVTEVDGSPLSFPEVIIIDGAVRDWQNLLRFEKTLASLAVENIQSKLDGLAPREIISHAKAFILQTNKESYVEFGSIQGTGPRARLVAALERRTTKQLNNR